MAFGHFFALGQIVARTKANTGRFGNNTHMDKLGLDPCWTYPLGVGAHHGLVILPVWEGFLSLPFTDTDGATYEQFDLEAAELLDTSAVETLLREVRAYTDGLCAALEDMRSALQEAAE